MGGSTLVIIVSSQSNCSRKMSYLLKTNLTRSIRFFSTGRAIRYAQPLATEPSIETNAPSETNRLEKTLQTFWEKVDVAKEKDGFHVRLDGKSLKTPLGNQLVIPSAKKSLAYMVCNEWKNLSNLKVKPHSVPLTSLSTRAIDLGISHAVQDLEALTKLGNIEDIKTDLLRYLDTDTVLIFSPKEDCDGKLRRAQEEMYRPLIASMESYLQQFAENSSEKITLNFLDSDTDGFRSNYQNEATKRAALNWMNKLNVWELVALEKATLTAKSFLCGVAIVRANNKTLTDNEAPMDLESIARAASLEVIYQTERWGEVEDTHDVDKVDLRRNLAAAALVAYELPIDEN